LRMVKLFQLQCQICELSVTQEKRSALVCA
jgi:hypothetical protein